MSDLLKMALPVVLLLVILVTLLPDAAAAIAGDVFF